MTAGCFHRSHRIRCAVSEHPVPTVRIVLDPMILAGKPVIRGTRLTVDFVIGLMADDWNETDILRNYPGLSHDDLAACFAMLAMC